MNITIIPKILIISIIITVFSCSGKPKQSRKPVSQIKIENKQNKLVLGDDIVFIINTKIYDGELKNTKIYIDDELIDSVKELSFTKKVEKFSKVGKHTLKVVAEKTDKMIGINYKSFDVVSDVIPEQYGFKVINTIPHNTKYFTEGLEIHDNFLFESTGENGTSGIYKMKLPTAHLVQSVNLDEKYFGEGITILDNKIYQLTYKAKTGFIYDLSSFSFIKNFTYESEQGWGMTNDGKNIIMSDGTHVLTYIDPQTMQTVKKLQVADNKGIVPYINELEYSDGYIFANIYTTETIIKIDASSGKVVAKIDLKGILGTYTNEHIDVMNGIAIDPVTKKMYITGKLWPKLFEIELTKTK